MCEEIRSVVSARFFFLLKQGKVARKIVAILSIVLRKEFTGLTRGEISLILLCQLGSLGVSVSSQLAAQVDLAEDDKEEEEAAKATVDRQVLDVVVHFEVGTNRHHRCEFHIRRSSTKRQRGVVDDQLA